MTDAIERLKSILSDRQTKTGKVVRIEGNLATVSTNRGPVRANMGGNALRVGDNVSISGETIVGRLKSDSEAPVYRI